MTYINPMNKKDALMPSARITKQNLRLIQRMAKRTGKRASSYVADAVIAQAIFDEKKLSLGINIKQP